MPEKYKGIVYYTTFALMLTTLWMVAWARSMTARVEHYRLPPIMVVSVTPE